MRKTMLPNTRVGSIIITVLIQCFFFFFFFNQLSVKKYLEYFWVFPKYLSLTNHLLYITSLLPWQNQFKTNMIIRIYRQRSWKSEKLTQFIYINIKRKWRSKNLRCNHNVIFGKSAIPKSSIQFSSVQSLSRVRLLATPWIAARQASLSITNSRSLLQLMPIESVMPSSHLILCHPLLLLSPTPPSIRIFSNESALHIRWPKYWSFSFNISPSNEHPGLISFRMDWLDLLAVQGTLKIRCMEKWRGGRDTGTKTDRRLKFS